MLVEVEVTLQLTDSQSVCQGIEPTLGLVTRYYFLSEGCCLKVAVFICHSQSLVIYQYLHQTFMLYVFYTSAVYVQYI
jgi:hypothetical protein